MHAEITIAAIGRVFRDADSQQEISYTVHLDLDRVRRWIRKTAAQNKTRESVSGPLKIFVKPLPPGVTAPHSDAALGTLRPSGAQRNPGDPPRHGLGSILSS